MDEVVLWSERLDVGVVDGGSVAWRDEVWGEWSEILVGDVFECCFVVLGHG